jgi:membrane protease YdiL (CAAX protease family)
MLLRTLQLPRVEPDTSRDADREAAIVLLSATALLVVFAYWGRPGFYASSGLMEWARDTLGGPLVEHPGVGGYLWWGITSLVLRVLVPVGVIVWLLRGRPTDYGFRLRGIAPHLPAYGLFYLAMLPVLVWASSLSSFREFYPFYERAAEGGAGYWLYSFGYALQFVGLEAFFRGFLTFGLLRRFGLLAVPIMTVPYTMIHFTKPMPEAIAAIGAGLILGYMAVRSKSFVPGAFLHISVAITMDVLVLWRSGALVNLL